MKIIFNTILLVTVFFLNGLSLYGQTTIHPKLGFIGYHPFDEPNRRLFDNNIDANKTFIAGHCECENHRHTALLPLLVRVP